MQQRAREERCLLVNGPQHQCLWKQSQDASTEGTYQEPKGRENIFPHTQIFSEKLLKTGTGLPWTRVQGWKQFLWCCRSKVSRHTSGSQVYKTFLSPWMVGTVWEWYSHGAGRFRVGKADGIKYQLLFSICLDIFKSLSLFLLLDVYYNSKSYGI